MIVSCFFLYLCLFVFMVPFYLQHFLCANSNFSHSILLNVCYLISLFKGLAFAFNDLLNVLFHYHLIDFCLWLIICFLLFSYWFSIFLTSQVECLVRTCYFLFLYVCMCILRYMFVCVCAICICVYIYFSAMCRCVTVFMLLVF